jgi:hypothetical protein
VGSPAGRPIVLAPPNDLLGLGISEWIEDGLSFFAATGLGMWAAGSAGFMPKIAALIPDFIEAITVYGHADPAGRRGALDLAIGGVKRVVATQIDHDEIGTPC